MTTRVVIISDTHGMHRGVVIPDGDLLIHAGDCTGRGTLAELAEFNRFLGTLPHAEKILIAGNHDWCFAHNRAACEEILTHASYLEDEAREFRGLRIWGSPWQPRFFDWAFNLDRGAPLREKWDLIPDGVDILVTHGPPAGHGDLTRAGDASGCVDLLAAVERVRPRLHVFGHIHEAYGRGETEHTTYINGSTCDIDYRPVNPPIVEEL